MSETSPETQAETESEESETGEREASRIRSLDELFAKIGALEKRLTGQGSTPRRASKADEAADVGAQVKAEVAKLKQADDAEQRRRGNAGRLADLEAQVKKLQEKAPVEYRKITKFLWGDE